MYLEVSDVKKSYGEGGSYIQVLKGVSLQVKQGDMCVIQGTSGSGKSTLLNCIGGLDTIESGSIKVDGTEIAGMKADELSDYRRDYLGFIFQFYNQVPASHLPTVLLPELWLPLMLCRLSVFLFVFPFRCLPLLSFLFPFFNSKKQREQPLSMPFPFLSVISLYLPS